MSEQEKKWQKIYDLFNAETMPKFFRLLHTKQRIFKTDEEIFKEKVEWEIELKKKVKKAFLLLSLHRAF